MESVVFSEEALRDAGVLLLPIRLLLRTRVIGKPEAEEGLPSSETSNCVRNKYNTRTHTIRVGVYTIL